MPTPIPEDPNAPPKETVRQMLRRERRERREKVPGTGGDLALCKLDVDFIEEYTRNQCRSGTHAMIKCGVPTSTAAAESHRALMKPAVQLAIRKYKEDRRNYVSASSADILEEWIIVGLTSIKELINIDEDGRGISIKPDDEVPDFVWRAVKKIKAVEIPGRNGSGSEIIIEMHDKMAALINLAKVLGILDTKIEVSGKVEFVDAVRKASEKPMDPAVAEQVKARILKMFGDDKQSLATTFLGSKN